jgi:Pentapeptide repeats (8 copies)
MKADLANASARGADLANASARGADLANASARGADLANASARGRNVSRSLASLAALTVLAVAAMWTGQVDARGAVSRPAAAQTGIVPPKNPSRSLSPSPNFMASSSPCAQHGNNSACNRQVLKAISHARKVLEKMGGMSSFSMTAYLKLTRPEQLFVTADLERTERGLPAATVLSKSLDKVAQIGARDDNDPPLGKVPADLPGGGAVVGLGSNWAGGWPNALAADYGWMYDDGLNSPNEDCTKSNTSGCWGHRDNILGTFSSKAACGGGASALAMGAGYAARKASQTQLFAGVCGPAPTDVVLTWTKAKRLLGIK